jgi:tetratricopeptide (TPR) repeat protein
MKAQHRHDLQTNILADRVGRLLQGMKSTPKSTSMLVWVLVLLSFGTFAVWQYWGHATETQHSAIWTEVDEATHDPRASLSKLQSIGTEHPGSIAGRTATFELARYSMQRSYSPEGTESFSASKNDQAITFLKEALRLYKELAPQCADSPLLAQEALMGIAKAKESLVGVATEDDKDDYGTLDQALAAYQKLAEKYPESVLGKAARGRVTEIETKKPEIEKFYQQLRPAKAASVQEAPHVK